MSCLLILTTLSFENSKFLYLTFFKGHLIPVHIVSNSKHCYVNHVFYGNTILLQCLRSIKNNATVNNTSNYVPELALRVYQTNESSTGHQKFFCQICPKQPLNNPQTVTTLMNEQYFSCNRRSYSSRIHLYSESLLRHRRSCVSQPLRQRNTSNQID